MGEDSTIISKSYEFFILQKDPRCSAIVPTDEATRVEGLSETGDLYEGAWGLCTIWGDMVYPFSR